MTIPNNDWQSWPVYGIDQSHKENQLVEGLQRLTDFHRGACAEYGRMIESLPVSQRMARTDSGIEAIPFIPVRLFKHLALKSCAEGDVVRVLASSGTTGQTPSRIYLDKNTAANQTRALVSILQQYLGPQRLPMLVIDHPSAMKGTDTLSARGAGIRGLMTFGRDVTFALSDHDQSIAWDEVNRFIDKHADAPMLIFGFTSLIWSSFLQPLQESEQSLPLQNATLIHSGGWKKLSHLAVDNKTFKKQALERCAIERVHNFYGMVEQVGSIFVECEHGLFHPPSFADVIVRRSINWSPAEIGEEGIIQVLSLLPWSYPGHSLLTEDLGTIVGVDACPCGRMGKSFKIHGRLAAAEIRGCSDTMERM